MLFPRPTTRSPSIESYTEPLPASAVAEASYASGYPLVDDLFTFTPDIWAHHIRGISTVQKNQIKAHWKQSKGEEFPWYNELDEEFYIVVYFGLPTFALDTKVGLWRVDLAFRQVRSYSRPTLFDGGPTMINIEDLGAGSDITDRPVFGCQYGQSFSKVGILTKGAPAGIDDSNTVVLTLKNGAGSLIIQLTYNTANQPPTSDFEDLGPLLITSLDANDIITLTLTQGATANMPAFDLILE